MPLDWSNRHARLRFWLLCWSAIIFFFARHAFFRISFGGDWPIRADPAIVCFVLFLVYLYVLVQFLAQTRMEKQRIGSQIGKLYRTARQVERLHGELSLPRSVTTAAAGAGSLSNSKRTTEDASVMPSGEAMELMRQVRDTLAEFDVAAVRLELATSDISGTDEEDEEDGARAGNSDRLRKTIRDIAVLGRDFEQRTRVLEAAVESARAAEVQSQDPAAGAAPVPPRRDEAAVRLSAVEMELQRLVERTAEDSVACACGQVVPAVYVPVFVSLLLVALSADFIAGGALSAGLRLATTLAALLPA